MTWLDEVMTALDALGGVAPLSDIYGHIERTTTRMLPANWHAVIRQTLEDHSSDGAFRRGHDVFFSAGGKGSGLWGLRAADGTAPLDPGQLPEGITFPEGLAGTVRVNRYERSAKARKACISAYGARCSVCDFDFGATYGSIGTGYIHVHHIVPISKIDGRYRVDPVRDLRPVCPNCHAMLHVSDPPLSIEDLRSRLHLGR